MKEYLFIEYPNGYRCYYDAHETLLIGFISRRAKFIHFKTDSEFLLTVLCGTKEDRELAIEMIRNSGLIIKDCW